MPYYDTVIEGDDGQLFERTTHAASFKEAVDKVVAETEWDLGTVILHTEEAEDELDNTVE